MSTTSRDQLLRWLQTHSVPYSADEQAERLYLMVQFLGEASRAYVRAYVIGEVWRLAGPAWRARSAVTEEAVVTEQPLMWAAVQARADTAEAALTAFAEHDGLADYAASIERGRRVAEGLAGEARNALGGIDPTTLDRLRPVPYPASGSRRQRSTEEGTPESQAAQRLRRHSQMLRSSLQSLRTHPLRPVIEASASELDSLAGGLVGRA